MSSQFFTVSPRAYLDVRADRTSAGSHAAVETIAPGKLTYGTAATFMLFEFVKEGKLTGFDIDLINALSKEIRLTPAPMPMEFKGLIPALQGNVSISTPPCTSILPVPRRSTSCHI